MSASGPSGPLVIFPLKFMCCFSLLSCSKLTARLVNQGLGFQWLVSLTLAVSGMLQTHTHYAISHSPLE